MVSVAIAVKLLSSWMQFGLLFAPEILKLDFKRLNPLISSNRCSPRSR